MHRDKSKELASSTESDNSDFETNELTTKKAVHQKSKNF
jgi:hypothetical protein